MSSQKALRHSIKGTPEQLRQSALSRRHPAGVKEPIIPLSQMAIREAITAQLCPFCGRGPFAMLPVHTNKTHGVDKWELRELAGYSTSDPLCSAEAREKMSAAYDPTRGVQARATAASKSRRPPRRTTAGLRRNVESISKWMHENPEEAAEQRAVALVASKTDEARRRRSERLRERHAAHPVHPERAAAFRALMSAPEIKARREAVLAAKRQGCGTVASYKRGCRCDSCRLAKSKSRKPAGGSNNWTREDSPK